MQHTELTTPSARTGKARPEHLQRCFCRNLVKASLKSPPSPSKYSPSHYLVFKPHCMQRIPSTNDRRQQTSRATHL